MPTSPPPDVKLVILHRLLETYCSAVLTLDEIAICNEVVAQVRHRPVTENDVQRLLQIFRRASRDAPQAVLALDAGGDGQS